MIDYNQPWGWATPGKQKGQGNTVAPLGGGNVEGAPTPIQASPSAEDQLIGQMKGVLANKAVDGAAKGLSEYMSGTAAPVAASAGDTLVGGIGNAAETAGVASGVAGAASNVIGPLGAAVGGAMKGEYDEAAGAAIGSVLGAYFGPIGSMVGAKVGGYAGNAVGSLFGLADGTTKVPDKKPTPSIWERLVAKGEEAVKVSTGNAGAVGQAKQAISSRQERLAAEERKALGYADGTAGAGGKSAGGSPTSPPPGGNFGDVPMGGQGGKSAGGGSIIGRPYGSTSPTGYYGDQAQTGVTYKPGAFQTVNQQQQQAVPTVQTPTVWQPLPGSYGGGDSAGEGGGSGIGSGAGNGIGAVGSPSSGSGIGNAAEGDASSPDAGAGGGGGSK